MRFFELNNLQDFVLYFFPFLISVLVFAAALGYSYFHTRESEARKKMITRTYPSDIKDGNAPFPLCLFLIILGTVLWVFFYILFTGLTGRKI